MKTMKEIVELAFDSIDGRGISFVGIAELNDDHFIVDITTEEGRLFSLDIKVEEASL